MAGLFDTFTVAKRGIMVQQGAINTTSHNIANAKTTGYSRQRAVAETTRPFGGMSRFDTSSAGQVGTGAEITTIQRIRDTFIDYQVRSETGTSGYYTSKSETLSKIEDVFAEPSDKGLEELMTKFYTAFQEVSKNPGSQDVKAAAIKQASALCDQINYSYEQLNKACQDSQKLLKTNVTDVNSYLDQINELNKQIRGISALGQAPNDLMDKRDNLLDELSEKFGLKIEKDNFETINLSSKEYANFPLVKSNPSDTDYNRLSYVKDATPNNDGTITLEYYPLGNEKAAVQTITIDAVGATIADKQKNAKDLSDQLIQNRILIADRYGNVAKTTTTVTDPLTPVPTAPPNGTTVAAGVETVTSSVTQGTPPTTITTIISSLVDKTILPQKTTTITITDDGTTQTAKKEVVDKFAPTDPADVKKMLFKTYEYESGINDVDNNNVKGQIAGNQSVQNDLKSMMDGLDRLAEGLAYTVNAIQTGSMISGTTAAGLESGALVFVNNDTSTASSKTDKGITAKNLKINSDLLSDATKLNCNTTSTSGTGDGKRAAAISNLNVLKMKISNVAAGTDLSAMTREDYLAAVGVTGFADTTACLDLKGQTDGSTTDSYYKSLTNALGVEIQEANRKADNQEVILAKLQDDRTEVSGVSLDEETTNLIQFQHAYQANAKMIATIDELLDVVINGLKK
jgi:flagellar hook-associated protein 1 FlgK